ncbi:MAG: hypothetical protein ACLGIN_09975, partial [Candidatus Sericytochromatia bacterium]
AGRSLGEGITGGMSNYMSEQERRRQQAIQEAELARRNMLQDEQRTQRRYGLMLEEGQRRIGAGDYAGAASMIPQVAGLGNEVLGEHRVGPGLIEKPMVTQGPQGAMSPVNPDMSPVMHTPWEGKDGTANQQALGKFYGVAPPKPEAYNLAPGHSRYVGGELVTTAPYPEKPADPLADLERRLYEARIAATNRSNRGGSGGSGGDRAPLRRLVQTPDGSWVEVSDGAKTTPKPAPTPKPLKPFDEIKAIRDSRIKYPDFHGVETTAIKAQRESYIKAEREKHQRQQQGAAGVKSKLQQLVEMMEAEKAGR